MAVVQHAISKAQVDELFAGLLDAMPYHLDDGTVVIGNTGFRRPRRARLCERYIRHEPKRAPALPERKVTELASYEIDRRFARRKCAGTTRGRPSAVEPVKISSKRYADRTFRNEVPPALSSERRQAASWNEHWSIACSEAFHPVAFRGKGGYPRGYPRGYTRGRTSSSWGAERPYFTGVSQKLL
jgi:hypothetical protein